jgi:hypothetical protein
MAGGAKKWFIGCGIGCGVMLLILLGLGTVGFLGVKEAMNRGENMEASFDRLREEYGRPGEYTPPLDGVVPDDRMAAFLSIREAMAADRQKIGDILRTLDGHEVNGKKPGGIAKAKAGFQLIPGLMDFVSNRTDAMLEGGMGLGEYLYIYSLSYYSLLGVDLTDGPGFTLSDNGQGNDDGPVVWSVEAGDEDEGSVQEKRERKIRRYLHSLQLKMARNQLAALEERGEAGQLRDDLQAEIGRMEAETLRLLWETDMPDRIRNGLELYRTELEDSYDPMVNMLESGLVEAD